MGSEAVGREAHGLVVVLGRYDSVLHTLITILRIWRGFKIFKSAKGGQSVKLREWCSAVYVCEGAVQQAIQVQRASRTLDELCICLMLVYFNYDFNSKLGCLV